ncbi:hypothetical protein F7725_006267, partial [Dissostichus mawsoni]
VGEGGPDAALSDLQPDAGREGVHLRDLLPHQAVHLLHPGVGRVDALVQFLLLALGLRPHGLTLLLQQLDLPLQLPLQVLHPPGSLPLGEPLAGGGRGPGEAGRRGRGAGEEEEEALLGVGRGVWGVYTWIVTGWRQLGPSAAERRLKSSHRLQPSLSCSRSKPRCSAQERSSRPPGRSHTRSASPSARGSSSGPSRSDRSAEQPSDEDPLLWCEGNSSPSCFPALPHRHRGADQPAEAELFGGPSSGVLPEVNVVQTGNLQASEPVLPAVRVGSGELQRLQRLHERLRAQRAVVPGERGVFPGVNTGDDADHRAEEGQRTGAYQNQHELHSLC